MEIVGSVIIVQVLADRGISGSEKCSRRGMYLPGLSTLTQSFSVRHWNWSAFAGVYQRFCALWANAIAVYDATTKLRWRSRSDRAATLEGIGCRSYKPSAHALGTSVRDVASVRAWHNAPAVPNHPP